MTPRPLAIDLFCGLGGWTDGFLAEGYDVVGFDIERHQYGDHKYPAQLVVQDILTLHGSQFKDAAVIVASPPCQAYSYRAMPWKRAKELPPPDNTLFQASFCLQMQASEAAGRYIPLVVENVVGAQKWVGSARWHFGSFYLWGDVPALMPHALKLRKSTHIPLTETPKGVGSTSWFHGNSKHEGRFYGTKVAGMDWSKHGEPGYKAVAFNDEAIRRLQWAKVPGTLEPAGLKTVGHVNKRDGHTHTRHLTNQRESDAVKGMSSLHGFSHPDGTGGRDYGGPLDPRRFSSKSNSRKAASAMIAKIPFELSSHIARCFKPR